MKAVFIICIEVNIIHVDNKLQPDRVYTQYGTAILLFILLHF